MCCMTPASSAGRKSGANTCGSLRPHASSSPVAALIRSPAGGPTSSTRSRQSSNPKLGSERICAPNHQVSQPIGSARWIVFVGGRMATHAIVTHEKWLAARKKHLAKEKEFTRLRDQLSKERRELPWELVDKEYLFEGENGRETLADLFEGRGQLVIYHAMFNPETAGEHTTYTEDAPCFVCSFWMDNFNGVTVHLNHRDITMAAVSLAPYAKLAAYKKRMGWSFPWVSSGGSDFNFDYRVSFTPDELSTGKVDYNYRMDAFPMSEAPGI